MANPVRLSRLSVQLLRGQCGDEMMLYMRPRHKGFTCVFNTSPVFCQKRGRALCAVSGMLNGVFGSGKDLHVAAWQAVKVIDRSEETGDDGAIVQRERERFTNELTLVFASGETAISRDRFPRTDLRHER
jgi:hypothetical protein